MTTRRRLPNRRAAENISFTARNGMPITANVGYYPDGSVGEIFLVGSGKSGADLNIAMLEMGIAVSMALQHGTDINDMRAALPRTEDGKPEGAIGHLLDLLAKPRAVT